MWHRDAAAELRRLHALALDQQCEIYGLNFARATEGKILSLVKAALCEQKRIASNEHAEADRLRSELATLRAQNYETQSLQAVLAEREACLDWCAAYAADDGTAQKIEAAIRARREK
jgi:hypothetical protein